MKRKPPTIDVLLDAWFSPDINEHLKPVEENDPRLAGKAVHDTKVDSKQPAVKGKGVDVREVE